MAELILTDEEKAAALWSDLDDAAIGKLVRTRIEEISTAAEQMGRIVTHAAALLICCLAHECNATDVTIELGGVTQSGRDFGDWTVVATKTRQGAPR